MADPAPDRDIRPRRARTLLFTAAGVVLAFLIGFGWQWWAARGYRNELDQTRHELTMERMATTLASAVVQVDRGGYDQARELASRFFTDLQQHVGEAPPDQAGTFQDILGQRDAVIASLSRSEPGAQEMLSRMFVRYRLATGGGAEAGVPVRAGGAAPAPMGSDTGGAVGGGTAPGGG